MKAGVNFAFLVLQVLADVNFIITSDTIAKPIWLLCAIVAYALLIHGVQNDKF